MIFQNDEKCPVCDKIFTDNDDIVICPECGTPHHRECYKKLGHCINNDKHGTDFEYEYNNESADRGEYYQPDSNEQGNGTDAEDKPPLFTPFPIDNVYDNDDDTIDGKPVSDVAAVVRTNTKRFIPKFKKNSNISWNWGAFIFGPYYLFFRKMVSWGAIFIALGIAIQYFAIGYYIEPYKEYIGFMSSATTYSDMLKLVSENTDEIARLTQGIKPLLTIITCYNVVSHILIGLFADSIYRKKVLKILDNVEEKLKNGGSFNQSPMLNMSSNLSQAQMKKLYLGRLGGTSIITPLIASLVINILTQFIQ